MPKYPSYYVRPDGLHETILRINGKRKAFRGKTDKEVWEKVKAFDRAQLQAEIDALTDRRADLYRLRRKAPDDTACSEKIGTITARLRVLRRELKLCARIEDDIPTVRAQMEISKERSDHEKADKSRPEPRAGTDRGSPTH